MGVDEWIHANGGSVDRDQWPIARSDGQKREQVLSSIIHHFVASLARSAILLDWVDIGVYSARSSYVTEGEGAYKYIRRSGAIMYFKKG